jgi:preprotein translocase subunit SecG
MNFLFVVVIVAVIGGAIWALTRKKSKDTGRIVGGGSSSEYSKNSFDKELE